MKITAMMLPLTATVFSVLIATCVSTFTKIHFPSSDATRYPHLRLINTLPPMQEFTFCTLIKPHSLKNHLSTIFSYATARSDNELIVGISNSTGKIKIHVYLGTHNKMFECGQGRTWIGVWSHICVAWFGPNGNINVYLNGQNCNGVLAEGEHIRGGGVIIIGQEQDAVGSKFDYNQSWVGDIADLHLWDEVFTYSQIAQINKCRGVKKSGSVISLENAPMSVFDGVVFSKTNQNEVCKNE